MAGLVTASRVIMAGKGEVALVETSGRLKHLNVGNSHGIETPLEKK